MSKCFYFWNVFMKASDVWGAAEVSFNFQVWSVLLNLKFAESNETETEESGGSTTQWTHNSKPKTPNIRLPQTLNEIRSLFLNQDSLCTLLGLQGGQCFVGADLFQSRWTLAGSRSRSPHCFRVSSIWVISFLFVCLLSEAVEYGFKIAY